MENLTSEQVGEIKKFISSCDDMINGKFILADIKILKILNMIANSEPLCKYIQQCMIGFNFEREYGKASVKNRLSGTTFVPPSEHDKLIAMVFCLLVEFDKKHIDFYAFINQNFETLTAGGEYNLFAKTLLVPFRDIIANHFGLLNEQESSAINNKTESAFTPNQPQEAENFTPQLEEEPQDESLKIWEDIASLCDSLMSTILMDRKIKQDDKDSFIYVLKSIKYSLRYEDMRLVSALVTSLNLLLIKVKSTKFMMEDLKSMIKTYYSNLQKD